jgi:conjugal transfer pilus assembly protein TraE
MHADQSKRNVDDLRNTIRIQQFVIVLLFGVVFIAMWAAKNSIGTERTVMVPTSLHNKVWVSGKDVDPAYLTELADDFSHLLLDISPGNTAYKRAQVLKWAAPDYYGELEKKLKLEEERLRRDNASSMFWLSQVRPYPDRFSVAIYGQLATYVNDRQTSVIPKSYLIEFRNQAGLLQLKSFKEANYEDPLGIKAAATAAVNGAAKQ